MAELACLTNRAGGAKEVLPALEYLVHTTATAPLDLSSLAGLSGKDLVLIDATRDLSKAQALSRTLHAVGESSQILVIIPEAGLAGLQPDWGASDFVLPSAGPAEVEARIRLLVQRPDPPEPDAAIRVGELVVDPVSYQVRLRGRPLDLTYKEFELLRFLTSRPGRVSTRSQLLQEVWGYDFFGGTRTVDVHVRRLRAKLGPEYESMIATVRGVGYKLLPADQARAEREAGPDT
ncbi:MAG TPA: response regulator transcription factor [Actinomycetota bacterium]|nr:response regulator transcription factor [Actinomycetota bacterium]